MSLFGIHLAVLSDAQHKIVKAALAEAGHDTVAFVSTEAGKVESLLIDRFPALVQAFKTGFADVEDSSLQGFAKMEKVVADIVPQIPAIVPELANVAGLKDLLLGVGQLVFNDTLSAAKAELGKLVAAIL